jgi:hypothetical protein
VCLKEDGDGKDVTGLFPETSSFCLVRASPRGDETSQDFSDQAPTTETSRETLWR